MKRKHWYRKFFRYRKAEAAKTALYAMITLFIFGHIAVDPEVTWESYLEIIFLGVAFTVESLSRWVEKVGQQKIEDELKLEENHKKLVKRYPLDRPNMPTYHQSLVAMKECVSLFKLTNKEANTLYDESERTYTIPCIALTRNREKPIVIEDDRYKKYKLPEKIDERYGVIFEAHKFSQKYNALNVRLDSLEEKEDMILLKTSRTTYYDSLMTNRAMDYPWEIDDLTTRDLFCHSPRAPFLKDSLLSNHLGFNGFLVTSDDYIPLILRKGNVSIGKNTVSPCVAASLKCQYGLDEEMNFSLEGLENSVINEIKDETGLSMYRDKEKKVKNYDFDSEKHIINFYRDLVEGGKPQFLFHIPIYLTKAELEEVFKEQFMKKGGKNDMTMDGTLLFIHKKEMDQMCFWNNQVVLKQYSSQESGDKHALTTHWAHYPITPSAAASLALLCDYFKEENGVVQECP